MSPAARIGASRPDPGMAGDGAMDASSDVPADRDLKLPPPPVSQDPHRPLPEDLLRDASRRLGIMALIAAVLWITGTVLGRLAYGALHPQARVWTQLTGNDLIAATAAIISLGLFLYTRRRDRDPERVLSLGTWWLVLTALDL